MVAGAAAVGGFAAGDSGGGAGLADGTGGVSTGAVVGGDGAVTGAIAAGGATDVTATGSGVKGTRPADKKCHSNTATTPNTARLIPHTKQGGVVRSVVSPLPCPTTT